MATMFLSEAPITVDQTLSVANLNTLSNVGLAGFGGVIAVPRAMYGIMASSFSGVNARLGLAETTATHLGNDIGALGTSMSAVALEAGTNTLDIATISAWSATAAPIVSDLDSWSTSNAADFETVAAWSTTYAEDLEAALTWSASAGGVSTVSLMSATSIFDARLDYIETRLSHLFDAIAVYDPSQPDNSITFDAGGAGPSLTALELDTWLETYDLAEEE